MSIDRNVFMATGILLSISAIEKAFNLRIEGERFHTEPRFDPKTGKEIELETIQDDDGYEVFTVDGKDFQVRDLEKDEDVPVHEVILHLILDGMGDIAIHTEFSNVNEEHVVVYLAGKHLACSFSRMALTLPLTLDERKVLHKAANLLTKHGIEHEGVRFITLLEMS